jgi:hypothetical protein
MASSFRFRGSVSTSDGSTPSPFALYKEGTDELITVVSTDTLSIDAFQLSSNTGVTTLFLSATTTPPAYGYLFRGVGVSSLRLPSPAIGRAGQRPYIASTGVNRVEGVVYGTIYRA